MIEFKGVELHYHYDERPLLKDLSFTLSDGVNTVLCDTQSGKSSVCKLLVKQVKPTRGQIFLDGSEIDGIANESMGILYLPSSPIFFENRSIAYNIGYPLKVRKVCREERDVIVRQTAKKFGLSDLDRKIKRLSAEEKKRAALARAVTVKRKIVLLDDFCANSAELDKVLPLFESALTVIFTSDIDMARGNVIILDGGNVAYTGDRDGAVKCKETLLYIFDKLGDDDE